MNDNLRNYSEQPDAEVWQRIHGEMRRGRVRRQAIGAAAGVALVAAATVLMLHPAAPTEVKEPAQADPVVALVQPDRLPSEAQAEVGTVGSEPVRPQQDAARPQSATAAAEVVMVSAEPVQAEAKPSVEAQLPPVRPAAAQTAAVPSAPAAAQQEPPVRPVAQAEPVPAAAQQKKQSGAKSGSATQVQDTILWVPNVFVPASDDESVNVFRPRLNKPDEYVSNFKMSIFNRGGYQVFHTSDIATGWDGTYNGQALPQASYVYVIYYTDKNRVQHQRKGTVTLVR